MNLDQDKDDRRKWICLDKDDKEAGYVYGETDQDTLNNYMNCAGGFSCFDRPIYTLVNGETRLNVRKVVNFQKVPNLPDKYLIGSINPEYLDQSSQK